MPAFEHDSAETPGVLVEAPDGLMDVSSTLQTRTRSDSKCPSMRLKFFER